MQKLYYIRLLFHQYLLLFFYLQYIILLKSKVNIINLIYCTWISYSVITPQSVLTSSSSLSFSVFRHRWWLSSSHENGVVSITLLVGLLYPAGFSYGERTYAADPHHRPALY